MPTSKYNTEKQNTKAQLDAYNALKSEYDTFKQSKMTDEEKQAEQVRVQLEENQKIKTRLNEMTAKNIFAEAGFKKEDYEGLLSSVVSEDEEKTKTLAQTICNTMLKQKADIEKAVKDKLVKGTKTPPAGTDNGSGTESDVEKYKKLYAEAQKVGDYGKMALYTRLVQEAQRNNEE